MERVFRQADVGGLKLAPLLPFFLVSLDLTPNTMSRSIIVAIVTGKHLISYVINLGLLSLSIIIALTEGEHYIY